MQKSPASFHELSRVLECIFELRLQGKISQDDQNTIFAAHQDYLQKVEAEEREHLADGDTLDCDTPSWRSSARFAIRVMKDALLELHPELKSEVDAMTRLEKTAGPRGR
jgi:hypothetical protein